MKPTGRAFLEDYFSIYVVITAELTKVVEQIACGSVWQAVLVCSCDVFDACSESLTGRRER